MFVMDSRQRWIWSVTAAACAWLMWAPSIWIYQVNPGYIDPWTEVAPKRKLPPKLIDFEGELYEFPGEASDNQIRAYLEHLTIPAGAERTGLPRVPMVRGVSSGAMANARESEILIWFARLQVEQKVPDFVDEHPVRALVGLIFCALAFSIAPYRRDNS